MTNSKINDIMSAAYVLPATTGFNLLYLNNTNPVIVGAMFTVSVVSFLVLIGTISRYVINSLRK